MKMDKPCDGTNPIRGRVNVRFNPKRNTSRLRFNAVHQDQQEIIQQALEVARTELGTIYDTVALEGICLSFLGTSVGTFPAKSGAEGDETCNRSYEDVSRRD